MRFLRQRTGEECSGGAFCGRMSCMERGEGAKESGTPRQVKSRPGRLEPDHVTGQGFFRQQGENRHTGFPRKDAGERVKRADFLCRSARSLLFAFAALRNVRRAVALVRMNIKRKKAVRRESGFWRLSVRCDSVGHGVFSVCPGQAWSYRAVPLAGMRNAVTSTPSSFRRRIFFSRPPA